MSGVTNLPVEILSQIFQDVATLYEESKPTTAPDPGRRTASFPFNAAYTCSFWLQILKSNPQIWKSVVIDVAEDPTPFLDTLGLFEYDPIDVTIFSSFRNSNTLPSGSESSDDIPKHCENARAQAVFSLLEPLIPRCKTVVFDLIYQSSLPSVAKILIADLPNLEDLSLQCQIYDLDDDKSDIEFERPRSQPNISLPYLNWISVTGYAFVVFYETVLPNILEGQCYVNLFINHLRLHGQGSSTRSFAEFMHALEYMKCRELWLSDVSLGHLPMTGLEGPYDLDLDTINFDRVSPTFISAFLTNIDFDAYDFAISLSFTRCSIPDIAGPLAGEGKFRGVDFFEIPAQESLVNSIKLFNPASLRLEGCEGVTDHFFAQLSNGSSRRQRLFTLIIDNCLHFTPGALIAYLEARQRIGMIPIRRVHVMGKGPEISTEEAAWFRNHSSSSSSYIWEARCGVNNVKEASLQDEMA